MNNPTSSFLRRGKARRFGMRLALLAMGLLSPLFLLPGLLGKAGGGARAQEPVEPQATPVAADGLEIFADRCANCHGPAGEGDGEMAAQLPQPPRDFTDPQFIREAVPAGLFQVITEGQLAAGMPPFGPASSNPIPEAQRWDLVAAVYSLGTSQEALERGGQVYEEQCQACHGETGEGDGPEAAALETQPPDLTDLRYWSSRSNAMVFAALQDESIAAHTYALEDEALWDVTDYTRTFSYVAFDPQEALAPIAAATISGVVTNGTTGDVVPAGTAVLRAFTRELEETLSMEAPIGSDGRFVFELADVDPELIYLAATEYEDLSFNSSPDQLSRSAPQLELPITVYDKTTDPAVVAIEQVHMILDLAQDRVQVSEIYVLNNMADAVYVGETGNAADGTIEIALPAGAENVSFQRSFDSFGNFLPANELEQTERGWVDTLPLRPGPSALNLLVTYELPYESGMRVAHPVFYPAASTTLVLPDVGVRVEGEGWANRGAQQMGEGGTFLSYGHPAIEAGEALSLELRGRPGQQAAATVGGALPLSGDGLNGLIVGGTALLLAVAGAAFTLRSWRESVPPSDEEALAQRLLAVARLDDAFAAGQIEEQAYRQRREKLLADILPLWEAETLS